MIMTKEQMTDPKRTPASEQYWMKPDFKKLQAEWYAKLKESGFVDIEASSASEYVGSSQEFNKNNKGEKNGSGPAHHEFCHKILREFTFARSAHRDIFELHAEGKSVRDISHWLSKHELHKPMKRVAIANLIDRIKQDYSRG